MQPHVENQSVSPWKDQRPWIAKGDELGRLLDQEVSTLRELVDVSMAERAALLSNDVGQLLTISRQKEDLVEQMDLLESRRETLVAQRREPEPLASGEFSWDAWLKREPRERAAHLASARAEMASLVRRLMEIKEGNRLLLESSLEQVQVTLRFLLDMAASSHGYAHDGLPDSRDDLSYALVDCQV